ncbi:hypothetical protein IAI10_08515 [Clostridium sp. 19966]|uniref:hypothetical protein n=1 Tax=Clostridium sp. 19966 TaxID=2768166 RepID=UPI0028DFFF2E|nr:hypothetical protein [Clostridium sp. 19966]MDT8716699.1 hypothetical protein [Clostridium sp. 19966]
MLDIIVQYILILVMVLCVGYLIYFLKEKGIIRHNDYYGITYTILAQLENHEASQEYVKKVLNAVGKAVEFVEINYKDYPNEEKEERALVLSKELIRELELDSQIGEKPIRYIIRLACGLRGKY